MSSFTSSLTRGYRWLERLETPVLLLARLTLGVVFIQSGWGKLHNLDKVIGFFTELGIPAASLQAPLVAGTELVTGILLTVGLATRVAALPVVLMMLVALATARRAEIDGAGDLFGMIEYLYAVIALALASRGPGPLSLDALLGRLLARGGLGRVLARSPANVALLVEEEVVLQQRR